MQIPEYQYKQATNQFSPKKQVTFTNDLNHVQKTIDTRRSILKKLNRADFNIKDLQTSLEPVDQSQLQIKIFEEFFEQNKVPLRFRGRKPVDTIKIQQSLIDSSVNNEQKSFIEDLSKLYIRENKIVGLSNSPEIKRVINPIRKISKFLKLKQQIQNLQSQTLIEEEPVFSQLFKKLNDEEVKLKAQKYQFQNAGEKFLQNWDIKDSKFQQYKYKIASQKLIQIQNTQMIDFEQFRENNLKKYRSQSQLEDIKNVIPEHQNGQESFCTNNNNQSIFLPKIYSSRFLQKKKNVDSLNSVSLLPY